MNSEHPDDAASLETAADDIGDEAPPSALPDPPVAPIERDVAAIVSTPGPREVSGLLESIVAGGTLPGHLVIVTSTGADDLAPALAASPVPALIESVRVVRLAGALSPQRALTAGLAQVPADARVRYAWLLTHSCRPAPGALAALCTAAAASRTSAVIAPKVRTATSPPALISVGYPLTEAGRWVPQPRAGEADQGQYDDRSDVLATSALGALVDIAMFQDVGGYAPRLRGARDAVAADVDLGWRLHRAGGRVLLVSSATVDVLPDPSTKGLEEIGAPVRRTVRSIALGAVSLPGWLVRIPAVLGTALATAVLMLLAKQPRAAGRELVDGLAVLRLDRAWAAHRRFAACKRVPRRALSQLFVPRGVARTAVVDEVIPHRRRRDELSKQDRQLLGPRPQAVVHPAFLAVLAAVTLTLVQGRALGGSLVGRVGWGVTGGEVIGSTATAAGLWRTAADSWGGSGLGTGVGWSPGLGLLAAATAVTTHMPFLDAPAAPVSATVAALLFLTLPAATLSMYASLATITPHRLTRALGGLAWAATGLASDSVGHGRLGAATVLVVLPLAAAALIRALGPNGRSYDAAQAGLALAVIGAVAPVVAAAGIVVTLLLALVPGWSFRRAGGAAIVPLAVLAPFVRELLREPQRALGGLGLFDWSGQTEPTWRLALLDPTGTPVDGLPASLGQAMPLVVVPLLGLAVLGVMRGRHRGATLVAVLIAAGALAAAALLGRLTVDTVPIGTVGAGVPIRPWAGALLSLYALVVVGLAVRGLDVLARIALQRRGVRPLTTVAGLAVVGLLLAGAGWGGFGSALTTFIDRRPSVAVDHADGPLAGRSLLIGRLAESEGANQATAYRVVGADAGMPVRALPEPIEVSAQLDAFVARLDVGSLDAPGTDLPGGAAAVLARHAIGFVSVSDQLPADAIRSLDATDGLRRLPDRGDLRWWRVDATTSDVPSPARVVLRDGDGDGVVVPSRFHAQVSAALGSGGTLEVAQTPSWLARAEARLDGERLDPVVDGATVTYAVPAAGRLVIDLATPQWELRMLAAGTLAVSAFLALPFGGAQRREEEHP